MIKLSISFRNILEFGLRFNRSTKRSLQMAFDVLAIFISLAAAMFLRLETTTFFEQPSFFVSFCLIILPTLFIFSKMGLYRAFIRYISSDIAVLVAFGSIVSAIFIILTKLGLELFIPWSVPVIYSALLFIVITGSRFMLRTMINLSRKKHRKYVAIYGAGASGAQLLQSLLGSADYRVRMIIDDNPKVQGQRLYGIQVISFEEAAKNFKNFYVDIVLLAIPRASFAVRQKIISKINNYSLMVKTIPAIADLIGDAEQITKFKDIQIEDLLGREPIDPIPELMDKNIRNKMVLVTGAGGSIGSELCEQIIQLQPKYLLLFDISERAIYTISEKLEKQAKSLGVLLIPLIGAVQDRPFIRTVLVQHKVDTIYHAAAYKHVPLMEQNVMQAIKNNTIGTMILAEEAVSANVTSFTLISTDKAVNPTNIMGASKRLAERVCQTMNTKQSTTRFSIVRFGNVLGSSGSVVPLFQKQIAAGGPITLTHTEVIRYFMTVAEAVQLVIQASSLSKGGEVFFLDIGVPVKIKDLAFKMIKLSGLRPYLESDALVEKGDIAIRTTGLRPGEKMYEELSDGNNLVGTTHPQIMEVNETAMSVKDIRVLMDKLETLIANQDHENLIKCLVKAADYIPDDIILGKAGELSTKKKKITGKIIKLPTKTING